MFADLKELTDKSKYTRPIFNDCRGTLRRTNEGVTIDDIDFNSTNLISIKGEISVQNDGKMSGKLVVQLPQRLIDSTKTLSSINPPREGIYTLQVTIGGTIHSPYDNLSEFLKLDEERRDPAPEPQKVTSPPTPALPLSPPSKPSSPEDKEKEFEDLLR